MVLFVNLSPIEMGELSIYLRYHGIFVNSQPWGSD